MVWIDQFFRRLAGVRPTPGESSTRALQQQYARTRHTMVSTLAFGVEVRDSQLGIIEHCALVSMISTLVGRFLEISEADAYILDTAARLHEIGMFAIPAAVLQSPAPLSSEELQQVRSQARISAEVAGIMHHPRVARLIEHQYDDYAELGDRMPEKDVLLAGILRVADVVAAVTRPRPYQSPLPWKRRLEILQSGAGTRFHPLAAVVAMRLPHQADVAVS